MAFQPQQNLAAVRPGPGRRLFVEPFARDDFEAIGGAFLAGRFLGPDCKGWLRTAADKKKAETLVLSGDSGLSWTALDYEMVEVGGVEPPSESAPSPALHA